MCRKNKLPQKAVLGVDKKNNYLYGVIFENPESSTGFTMTASDDSEIECVAYQEVKPQKMWHKFDEELPKRTVVCISATGHVLIGRVFKTPCGLVYAENTDEVNENIVGWYDLDPYKHQAQIAQIFIYRALPVAAVFFAGLISNSVMQTNPTNVEVAMAQGEPELPFNIEEEERAALIAPRDMVATNDFIHSLDAIDPVNTIEITYDDYCHREEFDLNSVYYDVDGRFHYISDRHYVMSEDFLSIYDDSNSVYLTTKDYFISFLHTELSAKVINELEKYQTTNVYIKYGDSVYEEPFMAHHLWIQEGGEVWYLGYDGTAFHAYDGKVEVENMKNPGNIKTYDNFSIKLKSDEKTYDIWERTE